MHARSMPVHRKSLADPAATGVRLGVELRAAAEQEAYGNGMCLSHWIKWLVEEAISKAKAHPTANSTATTARETQRDSESLIQGPRHEDPVQSQLDVEYAREMGTKALNIEELTRLCFAARPLLWALAIIAILIVGYFLMKSGGRFLIVNAWHNGGSERASRLHRSNSLDRAEFEWAGSFWKNFGVSDGI